nr:lipopolysaccharide biosynthesis [Kastovskya adunca ATA6-11-RM4]
MTPPIVKRFLITLDRHKLLALASFGLVVGVSGVVALKPPPEPIYRAMGTLALNSAPPSFSTTGQQIQEQGKQFTKELLLADNLIQTVAAQVNEQPQELRQKANVRLPEEDDPPIIGVLYTDDNPQEAAKVVEALQTAMVEQSRLINTARLRATIDSIGQRLPAVSKELREAEQNLEKYNRTEGPVLFAAQDGTLVNSITASQQQQRQLQLTIEGIEAQMRSIQSKLGLTPEQAYASSALSADPIIANLRGQILQTETQIEILSKNLRPEHPQMVDLRKQQQSYNDLLRQRAAEVIGGAGVAAPL